MQELLKRVITSVAGGFVFFGTYLYSPIAFSAVLITILASILIFEWPKLIYDKRLYFITPIYPISPFLSLIYMNHTYRSESILLPLYPFMVAWACDIFAYFTGKLFGRHKICPSISPGKSWEGLVGGFISVAVINYILSAYLSFIPTEMISLLIYSSLLVIIALLGDIFISFLKRKVGLKDTSSILPGHGGFLDRFDSALFVAVFIFFINYK